MSVSRSQLALPTVIDHSRSEYPSASKMVSLNSSRSKHGSPVDRAKPRASRDFPAPGGPCTTTTGHACPDAITEE